MGYAAERSPPATRAFRRMRSEIHKNYKKYQLIQCGTPSTLKIPINIASEEVKTLKFLELVLLVTLIRLIFEQPWLGTISRIR